MKTALFLITALTSIFSCSNTVTAGEVEKPNILLICVDDLRPELACFGASYVHSPNIDRLASTGRIFRSHYVQAPTCGASRYTLLTGRYGTGSNSALFQRAVLLKGPDEELLGERKRSSPCVHAVPLYPTHTL